VIRQIVRHWRAYNFAAWNAEQIEQNRPYAVLDPLPFRRRLRQSVRFGVMDWREDIALRIAPWLFPEKPW
jgi:hypothetical protein